MFQLLRFRNIVLLISLLAQSAAMPMGLEIYYEGAIYCHFDYGGGPWPSDKRVWADYTDGSIKCIPSVTDFTAGLGTRTLDSNVQMQSITEKSIGPNPLRAMGYISLERLAKVACKSLSGPNAARSLTGKAQNSVSVYITPIGREVLHWETPTGVGYWYYGRGPEKKSPTIQIACQDSDLPGID